MPARRVAGIAASDSTADQGRIFAALLAEAGFRHIDAVSFVSPEHVRQMADSEAVLEAFYASLPSRRGSSRKSSASW